MLAGLLLATHDADDRPGQLAATLPFGGVTLIEYQARLLIEAGAAQIIVVVARLTPQLIGAMTRIGRRGVAVDAVRSAAEAVEKLHPLSRILMLGDGLITTASTVRMLAGEGGDALLVVPQEDASPGFERVGGQLAWAGIARLDPRRIVELALLPREYDVQSTLIRIAAQAQAANILLPEAALHDGHGIERSAQALTGRGRLVLAAIVSDRRGWFDRFVVAPIARLLLPRLVDRDVAGTAVAAGAGMIGAFGLAGEAFGLVATGLMLATLGAIGLSLAAALARLRDDDAVARTATIAAIVLPAVALLLLGQIESVRSADGAARICALSLVALAMLGERAIDEKRRRLWWGKPVAYLLIATVLTTVGLPLAALGAAAIYALATLSAAIEDCRSKALA
ncbi:hypothetical protein [Sphingomonas bacterium]|uniref:hypothetical protein n=1 Tax=Sphingomonas bacterium TaxID=1895847 RepID=UPI001575E0E3|nr:hypothetical protein [Sphingomonas bacterium]